MNRSEFITYKKNWVSLIQTILSEENSECFAEAALPAYSNPNPLMSYLFWERIWRVMMYIEKFSYTNVMDFGCGAGVMLPFLSKKFERVTAADTELYPLEIASSHMKLSDRCEVFNLKQKELGDLIPSSYNLILAIDVLEHVEDLSETLPQLLKLLIPGGKIIISGPTENFAYKIGRKLAGKIYSGHYHSRNIYEIKNEVAQFARIKTIGTLFYPVPLFKIYCGTKL